MNSISIVHHQGIVSNTFSINLLNLSILIFRGDRVILLFKEDFEDFCEE